MRDHLLHHEPQVRAVGDHLLHEPKNRWKNHTSTNAARTQRESFSRNGILKNNRHWSILQDKTAVRSWRKMVCPLSKEKWRSIEGSKLSRIIPGKSQIGPVPDAFVSEDQGLMRIEIQVPAASLAVDTAWERVSRGVTPLARQTGEFAPEIEGMNVTFGERRHSRCSSPARRSQAGHWGTDCSTLHKPHRRHHATDSNPGSQKPSGRGSGDRLLSKHG